MLVLSAAMLAALHLNPVKAPKRGDATLTVSLIKSVPGLRPLAFAAGPTGARFAATMEDNSVKIIDAATRMTLRTFTGHPQPAYAIAWSADGAYLATGDETGRIFIWDARTGQKLREMRKHIRGIQSLSFNLPRTLLVSTGKDDVIKVWDLSTGKDIQTILGKGSNFNSATYEPVGNTFLTGFLGAGCRFYDGKGNVTGFLTGHNGQGVWDVAFNARGTRAVTGGRDNLALLWDMKTKKSLGKFVGHGDWVTHVRFSPSGTYVATSSTDRTVRVFNMYNFKQVAELDNECAVGSPLCFTADGKYLLTVGVDDSLQINGLTPPQPTPGSAKPVKKSSKGKKG